MGFLDTLYSLNPFKKAPASLPPPPPPSSPVPSPVSSPTPPGGRRTRRKSRPHRSRRHRKTA